MPIYEYVCNKCRHKFSVLLRGAGEAGSAACPRCHGTETSRLFSTFSVRSKTDKDIYEEILGDERLTSGMMSGDPKALAQWNKKMSQGLDQESGPEYDEMLERMEAGEAPTQEMIQELKGEKPEKSGEAGEEKS